MKRSVCLPACVMVAVLCAGFAEAQDPAAEHASHHPSAAQPAPVVVAPNAPLPTPTSMAQPGAPATGMAQGMEKMMERMGAPPPKEIYPSLMELPDLPLEKREQVLKQARERMQVGAGLMSQAVDELAESAKRDDYPAMQRATASLRQGLAQFESGLAAHRALTEGKAPRNVAMQWFKRELNLMPVGSAPMPHGFVGLSAFHYVTMAFAGALAVVLLWTFLARQRRASALAAQLVATPAAVGNGTGASATDPHSGGTSAALAPSASIPAATGESGRPIRAAMPVSTTGSWSGQLRVARIFQETVSVKTFRLAPLAGEELPFAFEPGQFLTIAVNAGAKVVKRSYSIASSPCCHGWCEITVKHAPGGVVSGHLHEQVKVGDILEAAGPYGRFTFRGHEARDVVMIAGGVGITPLMSSLRFLTDQSWSGEIWLIYACPRFEDVIFREELDYLAKRHPNLHVTLVLEEPSASWSGALGFVTAELLTRTVPDLGTRRIHLCGPPPMLEAMEKVFARLGVTPEQVHTELFLTPEVRRTPAVEAAPASLVATCSFSRSGKKAPLPPDKTVLEAAEAVGVAIDYSCRQGFCGVCKVRLLAGQVTMEVDDGLTPADRAEGLVLACQARAGTDVTVEA